MSDIKILFVFFLWPSTCSLACGWGGGGHPTAHRPPHLSKTTTPLKDHHTSQKTTSPPHLSKDHHTSQKTTTPLKDHHTLKIFLFSSSSNFLYNNFNSWIRIHIVPRRTWIRSLRSRTGTLGLQVNEDCLRVGMLDLKLN